MDNAFLTGRITATKAAIIAAEDAQTAILSGALESYSLDTGQTVTKINKLNIGELSRYVDALYNRCAMLQARQSGSNIIIGRPGF
jgi:hypothetical protein